jgi:4-hydroxy-4-methyl-2-oxoglutarate aldolase
VTFNSHSTATLFESARSVAADLEVAADPAICAAWHGARVAGPAFTIQGAGGDNLALRHALLTASAGHVLVADVGGALFGHWGEILADTAELKGLDFPVFSRNHSIRGARKLFRGRFGVGIHVGGIAVHTGDLVVGDDDGVAALRAGATTLELYGLGEAS